MHMPYPKVKPFVGLFSLMLLTAAGMVSGADAQSAGQSLSFEAYIQRATTSDAEFEQILIDELTLKYQKDLQLPARDLVLSVKQQHEFFFSQDRESPDTTVGLSKLFPLTGTEIAADYQVGAGVSSGTKSSSAAFTLAQPIAENAFGRSTRLLDKIVDLEVDVSRHQIVEAYEDYLAQIITAYYTWYEDYENLLIGRASYQENAKLLDNMKEREKQKIALPIDVNKVRLQVLSRKERLIELEEQYQNSLNVIKRAIRASTDEVYIPQLGDPMGELSGEFEGDFQTFTEVSRTFGILNMLEQRSSLNVAREADDLLPSIKLIAGYEVAGRDYDIDREDNFFYAGLSLEWPLSDQVVSAEYQVSQIVDNKQQLTTVNTYHRLYTQLANLYLQIEREQKLMAIADERIELAQSILEDERENYSFGKVTLNDYIQAFNTLDTNRFNKNFHDAQYRRLLVEWLRLTDQLVTRSQLEPRLETMEDAVE